MNKLHSQVSYVLLKYEFLERNETIQKFNDLVSQ